MDGVEDVGAIVGNIFGSPRIVGTYWNNETTGQTEACGSRPCRGAEGRTTEEMTSVPRPENTYVDWDFENTWAQTNNNYPWLRGV